MDGISTSGITDKDLIEVKDFEDNIQGVLAKFGQKLQDDLIKSLDKKKKNASGDLRQSIQAPPSVSVSDGIYTYVLSMASYYEFVDEGRKAGKMPPIDSLIKWVKQKSAFGGLEVDESKDVRSVAFGIAKNIAKFGIKPSYFFTNVIDDGRLEQLTEDLATAGAQGFTLDNR
tara:strand:+ start:295 stop:810 length:516 start_codon:yes stop_codon:yes gene_type:complete